MFDWSMNADGHSILVLFLYDMHLALFRVFTSFSHRDGGSNLSALKTNEETSHLICWASLAEHDACQTQWACSDCLLQPYHSDPHPPILHIAYCNWLLRKELSFNHRFNSILGIDLHPHVSRRITEFRPHRHEPGSLFIGSLSVDLLGCTPGAKNCIHIREPENVLPD